MIMHWIIFGVIFILAQPSTRYKIILSPQDSQLGTINSNVVSAVPIPQDPSHTINPFIRHWESAQYDIDAIRNARQHHDTLRRKKREAATNTYSNIIKSTNDYVANPNKIKLNFFAHDRQFNVVLREDPFSVFSSDVQIENTLRPLDYDVSRVYTGTLEGK